MARSPSTYSAEFAKFNAAVQCDRRGDHEEAARHRRELRVEAHAALRGRDRRKTRRVAEETLGEMTPQARQTVGRAQVYVEAAAVVRTHRRAAARPARTAMPPRVPLVRTAGRERGTCNRTVTSPRRRRSTTAASKADPLPGEPDPACRPSVGNRRHSGSGRAKGGESRRRDWPATKRDAVIR